MIRHFRLLAGLRWKYLWRTGGRTRRWSAGLALVASLVFGAGLYFLSSTSLSRLFERHEEGTAWEIVHLGFAILYFLWLYSGSLNDLYDPARLNPYPIPARTIFLGSTLSSFIGLTSIFGGALLAGFAVGVKGSAVEGLLRAGLFVFLLVHLQMVSRLIRLTFLAVLTSRRWRDAALLISTLIGGALYVLLQLVPGETSRAAASAIVDFARAGGPSSWLAWYPPVWLSWAYELDGLRSAAGFGAFALLTAVVHRAGGWAEKRLSLSEPIFYYKPRAAATAGRRRFLQGISRAVLSVAGPAAAAVARKEIAVFFRDPAVRHRVLTSFFYILIPIATPFLAQGRLGSGDAARRAVDLAGFFLIFVEMFFLTNVFGVEGSAVRTLLSFPTSRRRILVGKNLAYLALFLPFNALVLAVLAWTTQSIPRLPGVLAAHLSALLVVTALGNVNSVYFPLPFLSPGQRVPRRDENSFLLAMARTALYLIAFALLAPVLLTAILLEGSAWALPAAMVGLVYAAGLYSLGLKLAESALLSREEALGDYFQAA